MIRKFAIAAAAIATLGTASLTASTPAAAWGKGGGFHHHHGSTVRRLPRLSRVLSATTPACAPAGS